MRLRFVTLRASITLCCLALAALLTSTSAQALPIDPASSGLDAAQGCADAPCAFSVLYNLDASAPVTGSIDIVGSTLDFSISLSSASLSGTDGAVSSVVFSGLVYSGSIAIALDGSGGATITDQTASISGMVTPNAGAAQILNAINVNTVGSCTGIGTGSPTCGLIFGPSADFNADINGNTRYFRHTVDVSAVPEPGTALLLGMGLTLLGVKRQR